MMLAKAKTLKEMLVAQPSALKDAGLPNTLKEMLGNNSQTPYKEKLAATLPNPKP